jgi:hypothetical protein
MPALALLPPHTAFCFLYTYWVTCVLRLPPQVWRFHNGFSCTRDMTDMSIDADLRVVPEACFDPDPPDSRRRCVVSAAPYSQRDMR